MPLLKTELGNGRTHSGERIPDRLSETNPRVNILHTELIPAHPFGCLLPESAPVHPFEK